ncbi:hypothetical protein JCM8547_003561 [Rhodosporidiobolus lusitaniae]
MVTSLLIPAVIAGSGSSLPSSAVPSNTSTLHARSTALIPTQEGEWSFQGCFQISSLWPLLQAPNPIDNFYAVGDHGYVNYGSVTDCLTGCSADPNGWPTCGIVGTECIRWVHDDWAGLGTRLDDCACTDPCLDPSEACGATSGTAGVLMYGKDTTPVSATDEGACRTAPVLDSAATTTTTTSDPPTASATSGVPEGKVTTDSDWNYLGCYSDSIASRTLPNGLNSQDWTAQNCLSLASAAGYKYAGVIYGGECWGGNDLTPSGSIQPNSACEWKCNDDDTAQCGGESALDIYETTLSDSAFTSPSFDSATATSTSDAPAATSTVLPKADNADWSYVGCYNDSVSARTLVNGLSSQDWTATNCLNLASTAGYKYAGVIYGGECWGANEIASTGTAQSLDKCNWDCNDARGVETCGGEAGLDVYQVRSTVAPTKRHRAKRFH